MTASPLEWTNWAGNQSFRYQRALAARTVDEVVDAVRAASAAGTGVRAVGSGHSATPVVETAGALVDVAGIAGVLGVDVDSQRAVVAAGTTIAAVGAPLWEAGFSLANQGDIDRQTLAGAVSTGTKGSGTRYGTMSATVTGAELVTGTGDVVWVDESTPRELHAVQVSLGLLGVLTKLELAVVPRYFLRESNVVMHVDELMDSWDELKAQYRHFSFWWMPTDASHAVYELPRVPRDHALVKLLREEQAPPELRLVGAPGERLGRAHLVYPDIELGDVFYELEYVLPAASDTDVFLALRSMMQTQHQDQASPVQVRWQRADEAFLSPQYQRDSVSVSVSGVPGTEWDPFLRDVDALLGSRDARPHWGKVHYLTADRAEKLYPELGSFRELRRAFDPDGLFLNPHLAEVLGLART